MKKSLILYNGTAVSAQQKSMIMKRIIFALSMAVMLMACDNEAAKQQKSTTTGFEVKDLNTASPDCDQYVLLSTSLGDIKIRLYREAPQHRKNFINLVMNNYYDGQIFYRVDPGSLIQAGDYTSVKNRKFRKDMGASDVDYTVPHEIDATKRIHKRGALAAPSHSKGIRSSGGHFFIVSNKKVKEADVDAAEKVYNKELVNKMFLEVQKPHAQELKKLSAMAEVDREKEKEYKKKITELMNEARKAVSGKEFRYTKAQRNAYLKEGGMPALDPYYTVFGEVVEGMDVVDAISWVSVYEGRPREDVIIKKITVINDTVE